MSIEIGAVVLALGRYLGRVCEVVPVQGVDGYSQAIRVKYQREIEPSSGWFLERDIIDVPSRFDAMYSESITAYLMFVGRRNMEMSKDLKRQGILS